MNPIKFVKRRPFSTLILVAASFSGAVLGLYKMRVEIPGLNTRKIYAHLENLEAKTRLAGGQLTGKFESYFQKHEETEAHHEEHKIVVTGPQETSVTITQPYVCQIHAQRHINVRALEGGYLEEIYVKEGQTVKKGDPMFKTVSTLYKARLDAENAEVKLAQLEWENTEKLFRDKVVSQRDVLLKGAKLAHAQAKADLAKAEMNFTNVTAPFDGIVDRLQQQLGSLIKEGDDLTTLSDNSVMWVYFNVPEADYLEYMDSIGQEKQDPKIQLILANHSPFKPTGKIGAIEAKFNNETGNIPFRADFLNPVGAMGQRLLRHGQTGTVLINRVMKDALIIPQRATFEVLDKRYVYVVDKDDVVHQREVKIQNTIDDIFVVQNGLAVGDKIVLEGLRQIRDGEKVEYEFTAPELVMAHLKNRAE